ncbi:MAG: hypothetical protein ACT4QF_08735 [Sporichthyaceae bacterium]
MSNRSETSGPRIVARTFGRWLRRRDERRHRKMLAAMLSPGRFTSADMYQQGLRPAKRTR